MNRLLIISLIFISSCVGSRYWDKNDVVYLEEINQAVVLSPAPNSIVKSIVELEQDVNFDKKLMYYYVDINLNEEKVEKVYFDSKQEYVRQHYGQKWLSSNLKIKIENELKKKVKIKTEKIFSNDVRVFDTCITLTYFYHFKD